MTPLRKRMLEELQRRNYSSETIRSYLGTVKDFARYLGKSPDKAKQEDLRKYQLYLLNERKLDIDSQRMVVHVRQGKGNKDRDVTLSPRLLEVLRAYWKWRKPKTYLFPSYYPSRQEKPITSHMVWYAVREAAQRAGIQKKVSPHLLRHSW